LVAAGALAGLALLTRSNGALVVLVLALAAHRDGSWRSLRSYRPTLALLAVAALVVAPWTIRNAVQFDRFIPVSDQDGYTLAGTYNATSKARSGIWLTANVDPAMKRILDTSRGLDEAELNERLRTAARRFALDHPGYVASVAWHNLPRLFNLGGGDVNRTVVGGDYGLGGKWAPLLTWGLLPFLLLATAGVFTRPARAAPRWLWAVPLVLLSTIFVLASNRHRAAIDPFLLLLAGLALVAAYSRIRARSSSGSAPASPK
jgi:4-amino-4-deoxy-L-arabinose transferase-like glycosyltransferase